LGRLAICRTVVSSRLSSIIYWIGESTRKNSESFLKISGLL
jgi:hypothetical protein